MHFTDLGLAEPLLRAIREQGYDTPTPIQAQAIPLVLKGGDVMGGAQTGTGKTAGFVLPMLQRLMAVPSKRDARGRVVIRALILTPTRELAAQVEESVRTYGKHLPLTSMVMFGGVGMSPQVDRLRAISGLLPWGDGDVVFAGRSLKGMGPRETARAGLVHVVEGHRIFTQQSVTDNLLLAAYDLPRGERGARIDEALSFFPEIAAKRHDKGGSLSGGQQQMLAVAQGLVRRPRLLMLDEPSAGLSPVLVDRVLGVVSQLRAGGTSVLLVEQLVEKVLAIADRVYAMAQGSIVLSGRCDEPELRSRLEAAYFGSSRAG